METETKVEMWAVVEIMGHIRVAGRVSEEVLFGTPLLRVDIPDGEEFTTRYFGGQSIYSLSPCSEEVARSVAAYKKVEPVYRYELPQLKAATVEVRERAPISYGPDEEDEGGEDEDGLGADAGWMGPAGLGGATYKTGMRDQG